MSFEFKDNSSRVLSAFSGAKKKSLSLIGAKQNEIMAAITPVDTGDLQASRGYRVGNDEVTVGVKKDYGVFVELGTRKMRAQPYLMPSIMNHVGEYENIVKNVMGSSMGISASGPSTTSEYYSGDGRVENV